MRECFQRKKLFVAPYLAELRIDLFSVVEVFWSAAGIFVVVRGEIVPISPTRCGTSDHKAVKRQLQRAQQPVVGASSQLNMPPE